MNTSYNLRCLLWNNKHGHDKIWGWVQTNSGNLFCFWGKRQVIDKDGFTKEKTRPSLSFKKHLAVSDLENVRFQKYKKGYEVVPIDQVENIVPGFFEFFEYALITARMTNKVKTDDWL